MKLEHLIRPPYIYLVFLFLFLVPRLALIDFLPFVMDEAIYSVVIEEMIERPNILPTFFGYEVGWKPPLFFIVSAVFVSFFKLFPLSLEAIYRLPDMFFGLLTVPVLYMLLRKVEKSRNVVLLTTLIFSFSFVVIDANISVLTDSLFLLFALSSLLAYVSREWGDFRFVLAGVLGFAAFYVKALLALIIPVLAVLYFFLNERKTLKNPLFLFSLVFVPLAYLSYSMLVSNLYLFLGYGIHFTSQEGLLGMLKKFGGALWAYFSFDGVWIALSLIGFLKFWRKNLFMTGWFALIVLPLITGYFMTWHFLSVIPAVSYFAALILLKPDGKERTDLFFFVFLSLMILGVLGSGLYSYFLSRELYLPQKEAGLFAVSRENVLILGQYRPGIPAYKILTELREKGDYTDFGWVFTAKLNQEVVDDFISDYSSDKYPTNSSFSEMFSTYDVFYRKESNITKFDYIVLCANDSIEAPGRLVYVSPKIRIYELD